ncbi:hypothetical protein [Streptomyces sp. WAC01280]|uniref:hypothetical protein n=1 Tax=Streptomyces sp. WAC01280 TaxID=2487424 RepID=UPI000F772B08|nr:hypothetical protein [Streptomyces sp. WAC01280]RSS58622.1 hypothetical protein EF909_01225 [Streptomyces sp. WAC01280]
MSASENSERNQFRWTGPYAVPDYPDLTRVDDPDVDEGYEPAASGEPRVLPAPFAEKARAARPRPGGPLLRTPRLSGRRFPPP